MQFIENNKKKFPLIAVILLGVATLIMLLPLLTQFLTTVENLFEGVSFKIILRNLLSMVTICVRGIVPLVFAVFALIYMKTDKLRYVLAIAAGVALLQLLQGQLFTLISYVITQKRLENILNYAINNVLPGTIVPYALYALVIVFALKKTDCPAISVIVATLIACLLIDGLLGNGRSIVNLLLNAINYKYDLWSLLKNMVRNFSYLVADLSYYVGLLLVVPMALRVKANEEVPAIEAE